MKISFTMLCVVVVDVYRLLNASVWITNILSEWAWWRPCRYSCHYSVESVRQRHSDETAKKDQIAFLSGKTVETEVFASRMRFWSAFSVRDWKRDQKVWLPSMPSLFPIPLKKKKGRQSKDTNCTSLAPAEAWWKVSGGRGSLGRRGVRQL